MKAGEVFGSRGSAMVQLGEGVSVGGKLAAYLYEPKHTAAPNQVLVTCRNGEDYRSYTEDVRPIPQPDNWFENVWARYRERQAKLPQ